MRSFPDNFLWGVSTSAHQFEGGTPPSQWLEWERAGRIRSRDCRGNACDWWVNAERDLDLCESLGLNALRISVEWSRIEPERGKWNREAIERYCTILREVRRRGMRPFVTLHHFTNPQWFEKRGGFTHPAGPGGFAVFAERAVECFGELCSDWVTFNEPNVYTAFGYLFGEFPPSKRMDLRAAMLALMGIHQGHALAYERLHAYQPQAQVGMAINYVAFEPASRSVMDGWLANVYHELFNLSSLYLLADGELPRLWWLPKVRVPDAKGKCDFIGLNVYNRFHVSFPYPFGKDFGPGGLFVPPGAPQGDRGVDLPYGEAYPLVIRQAAESYARLGKPMMVLENGVPDREDRIRPWVMVNTLREMGRLISEGHDLRGYFHWSLVDNFEWNEGWTLRFGLYELDTKTQERRARRSAELYRDIIASNGLSQEADEFGELPGARRSNGKND
ncbi:MAG TPA: glycoside hydrolase family 1 protein [Candidatus Saccharimonadales bacterium]|nr:glycoside hydrolase family 1 protein [Candidatus Saccharimonadales bacterium]